MSILPLRPRDFEILRTLLRVQFATSAGLQRVFFSDKSWARKRLSALRYRYGVIAPHSKGLPGPHLDSEGLFWCLSPAGLDAVAARYPGIRVPNNHYKRCKAASLRNFEHRIACSELYLGLITFKRQGLEQISERADQLAWYYDRDVRLPFRSVLDLGKKPKAVYPDATFLTPHARIFLELDRSTESLTTCKEALNAYRSAVSEPNYSTLLPGTEVTYVVYVTPSESRAKNLRAKIASMGPLPFRALVLDSRQAPEWLSSAATEEPGDGRPMPSFAECLAHLKSLFAASHAELVTRGRLEPGQVDNFTPALNAAHAFLQYVKKAS